MVDRASLMAEDRPGQRGLRAAALALLLGILVLLAGIFPTGATAAQTEADGCGYRLGFASLRDALAQSEGNDIVGQCQENEYHAPNGDGVQLAEGGLLLWRKAGNWTGFTDGRSYWVASPTGPQKRSNAERFPWEPAAGPSPEQLLAGLPTELPAPVEVDEQARQLLVLHRANGGATFNRYLGDLAGAKLFAVSLYPDRSVVIDSPQPPLPLLREYVVNNLDLLQDPRVAVGTWFDEEDGKSYLDLSATVPDRQQAIELGSRYNQISIFDLGQMEDIPTGGTGEAKPNLPPPTERLRPLEPAQPPERK